MSLPSPLRRAAARRAGYTLIEVACVIVILAVVFVLIVTPVILKTRPQHRARQITCLSHEKQIGLAFLQYEQDYDDMLPPAVGWDLDKKGKPFKHNWAVTLPKSTGLLEAYVKAPDIFRCPETADTAPLSYLYNDFAAPVEENEIVAPTKTVLVTDGEEVLENVGHAYVPHETPQSALYTLHGSCAPGQGATLRDAPRRHAGGAVYLLADGHAHWFQPTQVFFPPHDSAEKTHRDPATRQSIGPDPSGNMQFDGHDYAATFHLR